MAPKSASNPLPPIQHVVVLMMENRSLDNLLGWLYTDTNNQPPNNLPAQSPTSYNGLVPNEYSNTTSDLGTLYTQNGTTDWPPDVAPTTVPNPDPGESFDQMTQQIFGTSATANMSGFLANYEGIAGATAGQIMQSYSTDQVPIISTLARSFAVCDAWYASAPCQTWPNRGFVHTGSSDGHINNDDSEPYDINTIFNLLDSQNISWAVYNDTTLPSLVHLMFPKLWMNTRNFMSMDAFYTACQAPAYAPASQKLPTYTFLEPNFGVIGPDESYHPPDDVGPAEAFLQKVYAALQGCAYRDDVLFVITFDEHGGCYDHVAPPGGAVAPEPGSVSRTEDFSFNRFGVRVPTILISSYVTPGTVFRAPGGVPYDHTSILATLRDWLGMDASTFTATLPSPRITAAPTLAGVLTETTAQSWPTLNAPRQVRQVNMTGAPANDLHLSILIGAESRRRGGYIGHAEAAELRRTIQTRGDAAAWLARIQGQQTEAAHEALQRGDVAEAQRLLAAVRR
jgi:phospholipase C